ncbi:MAG: mRNA interferase MazF [Pyrinomonadaceae bacterium]|jgi:mRNA interferase MazF|nr:mRNA interferase MazF [Pyrinomonadaceae bacterium]HBB86936.1 PemK-like protein [Blastocatellia bacterium]
MAKGKIVLVPFPFDDLSTFKVRPALCLTEPIGPNRHILVAFITSRIHPDLSATDILLDPTQPDFAATGLKVASTLKLHRVTTVPMALIRREIGMLSSAQQIQVDDGLRRLLQL